MSDKGKVGLPLGLAGAASWFGYHCGSGFASGAQVPVYVTKFGKLGFLVPVCSFLILAFVFYIGGRFAQVSKVKTYKEFAAEFYIPKIGWIFVLLWDLIATFTLFVGLGGCIAGGATLVVEYFNAPYWLGVIVFGVILSFLLLLGDESFVSFYMDKLSKLVIPMVIMLVTMALIGIFNNWDGLMYNLTTMPTLYPGFTSRDVFDAIYTYVGIQTPFLNALIPFVFVTLTQKKDLKTTVTVGGPLNAVMLTLMALFIFTYAPEATAQTLPYVYILNIPIPFAPILKVFYFFIMVLALISTGSSCLLASTTRFLPYGKKLIPDDNLRRRVIVVVFTLVCMAISSFGLMSIVKTGYGLLAKAVVPVIVLPILLYGPFRIKNYKKEEISIAEDSSN